MSITSKDIISLSHARAKLNHRLEREHIHLGLLEETIKGLTDSKAGKTLSLAQLKLRHGR